MGFLALLDIGRHPGQDLSPTTPVRDFFGLESVGVIAAAALTLGPVFGSYGH
jgi:hypothetical protein